MTAAERQFPASSESLAPLFDFLRECSVELQLPRDIALKVELAAEELFTNSVCHGGASGAVRVVLTRSAAGLEFVIEDGGTPYDPFAHLNHEAHQRPLEDRPVGGLGVVLVDALASRAQYARVGGRNRVTLTFEGLSSLG